MRVTEAQELWSPAATYLNTASYGLPPRPAWDALQCALEDWRGGRTSWEHWGIPGEEARASFARLVGVPVESVAIGPNVSTLVGLVAASIPDGSRVLAPDVEFTSELFPFLVQERRGVTHPPGPRSRAGGRDRAGRGRRRVQRRADGDGRGRGSRRHRRRSRRARRDDGRRRNTGSRLAADRREPIRRGRRPCVQVADVAARDGLHDDRARTAGRGRPTVGRLVRGRGSDGDLLRRASAPRDERPATRHVSRLVHVGGHGTGAGGDRRDRRRRDPRARPRACEQLPCRARPRAEQLRDRLL